MATNRAPTGVSSDPRLSNSPEIAQVRESVDRVSKGLGRKLKLVVGKPGLDGHSNGAEQIAVRARDCGMDVAYEGIRLTPEEIVESAKAGAHVLGLSILSGSHLPLVEDVLRRLKAENLDHIPVIVGGIIPPDDEARLKAMGVTAVYTPKNFDMTAIMADMVRVAEKAHLIPA